MRDAEEERSILVGRKPVLEALGRDDVEIEKVLLQQGGGGPVIEDIRRGATSAGIPFQYVPPAKLSSVAGNINHQGVVALISPIRYAEVDEMLSTITPSRDDLEREKPLLIMLDQIEDPHNYGAIVRSAVAAGARGVIVPRQHMAPLNAAAVKASAGTAVRIPIARVTNLADTLQSLKERGYWVAGATGEGTTSVWEMDWNRPLVLVVGSEGKGLRPRVREACDYLVHIPMRGPAESLNASVAAGILLFAATRTRS